MIFIIVYIILFNFGQTEADCIFPCPKYHNSFGCDFYNSSCFSKNKNVLLNNTSRKPARPANLQTRFFDNDNITFTWNADTSTIKDLRGFVLNLTILRGVCGAGQNNIIRAFEYTNTSQIENNPNELFSLKLKRLCPDAWRLDLYSLPKANCSKNVVHQILMLLPKRYDRNNDAWQSQMAITYSYPVRNIKVNFTKAPKKFNFQKYNIFLNKNNETIESKIIHETAEPFVTFEGDFSGKYTVKIQPFESFPNDKNRCLCRTKKNTCTPCKVTSSYEIEFIDICRKDSTPESNNIVNSIIAVGVLATIIIMVLIVKCFICKSSKKLPQKYAILLCLNDHSLHDKAVHHLIQYLKDFGVIVHHADKFGKCVFDVYDIVLLINSTALAKRQMAWAEEKDYEQFFKEEHSSKLTNETFILIDELSLQKDCHKIISLKFDHVPDSPVFKRYPSHNGNFSIPKNLVDMVKNMVDVSVRFRGFKKQALLNAINNAAEYEECNKNWFSEKYGEPISESLITSLYSKDKKHMKNNNNNLNIDIHSCNVSELLQSLQKKNDEGMSSNFFNIKPTFSFDYGNNSILNA